MKENGSIIYIGSVSGQYGGPRTAHYASSKAGLLSLSQVIARFSTSKNIILKNIDITSGPFEEVEIEFNNIIIEDINNINLKNYDFI